MRGLQFAKMISVLGLVLGVGGHASAAEIKVGDPAPGFTLITADKKTVTLAELKGKVVIINYWATWCVPCREELPLLDGFQAHFRDSGLVIFAIATEDSVSARQLRPLQAKVSFSLTSRLKGTRAYGIRQGVPTNYVIDRQGIIRHAKGGSFDLNSLNALIVPLLRQPPPPESIAAR